MKKEEKFLIELLGAYLSQQELLLDESVDYSRLFSISKEHKLISIAFCVIKNAPNKNIIPQDVYKAFENGFYETLVRYDFQKNVISNLDKLLCDNKIKHVFFKGSQLKELYPVPEARYMGDIDVLIAPEERDKVKSLLLENGYICRKSNGPVYDYVKDDILIEMHTKIISGKVGASDAEKCFADAFDNAEFDGFCGKLNDSYHFAYLITHIAHHFWFYGAGIKLILDLAIAQKELKVDYDIVFNKLKDAGLFEFAKTILSVCKTWFNVGIGFDINTTKTEEFMVSFGAFGNSRRNMAAVVERKELEEGKKTSNFATRFRLMFPPYSKLKNIPYISFIEGRPWLTPLAWIYRLFYNLKYKREFIKQATTTIGDSKTTKQAQAELRFFEEIGLI